MASIPGVPADVFAFDLQRCLGCESVKHKVVVAMGAVLVASALSTL